MNFVRGQDPKESMSIGKEAILKEIGGIIFNGQDAIERWKTINKWDNVGLKTTDLDESGIRQKNVVIGIAGGKFIILKNRIPYDGPKEGEEKDLIYTLLKIQEAFRKWDPNDFFMPIAQQVAARTIGMDLVPVKPLDGPTGHLIYLDYRYKKQNIFQKVFKKIFPTKPSKKPNI